MSGTQRTVRARASAALARIDETTAGKVRRRVYDLEVMNQALILSALALMLFIPALVTISAALPVGRNSGLAADFIRHLGLSPEAAADVQQLFHTKDTVRGSTTALSSIVTIVFAYGWPVQLQHGYDLIWDLPSLGRRALWRPLAWLVAFFVLVAAIAASGYVASGIKGSLLTGGLGFPVTFAWAWWTQHLLLGGRIAWRLLVPGALATAVALLGLSIAMTFYMDPNIISNYDRYGPIGVVFVLLSWMIGFSVVMLGGPLAGHTYVQRHRLMTQ